MSTWTVSNELYHHGIKGQKWGIRRFQNEDGSLTPEGMKRYGMDETTGRMSEKGLVRSLNDAYRTTRKENKELDKEWRKSIWKNPKKAEKLAEQLNNITRKNMGVSKEEFDLAVAKANLNDTKNRAIGSSITTGIITTGALASTIISGSLYKTARGQNNEVEYREARDDLAKSIGLGALGIGVNGGATALTISKAVDAKKKYNVAKEAYDKKYRR